MDKLIHDEDYKGPRWTYGLNNRPLGYANVPDGWIIHSDRELKGLNFGTIDYPRELTEHEVYSYELQLVNAPLADMQGITLDVYGAIMDLCREEHYDLEMDDRFWEAFREMSLTHCKDLMKKYGAYIIRQTVDRIIETRKREIQRTLAAPRQTARDHEAGSDSHGT